MYPVTETFYIGNEIYCVIEPVIIAGKQSTNWLGQPLWRADKVTQGPGKSSVSVTLEYLK